MKDFLGQETSNYQIPFYCHKEEELLEKIAGILTAAAIFAASAAHAHPIHYAMAAIDAKPVILPLSGRVYTALAGDSGAAKAEALAQCRDAENRDCAVIGSGALPHPH